LEVGVAELEGLGEGSEGGGVIGLGVDTGFLVSGSRPEMTS